MEAEEVFCTGTMGRLASAARFGGQQFCSSVVGEMILRLSALYSNLAKKANASRWSNYFGVRRLKPPLLESAGSVVQKKNAPHLQSPGRLLPLDIQLEVALRRIRLNRNIEQDIGTVPGQNNHSGPDG